MANLVYDIIVRNNDVMFFNIRLIERVAVAFLGVVCIFRQFDSQKNRTTMKSQL